MKVFSSLLGGVFFVLAVCFAVTNRQSAVVNIWPLGLEIETPLYLLTLGCLFLGLLVGSLITWCGLLPHRLAHRRIHQELSRLHDKLNELHQAISPEPSKAASLSSPHFNWLFRKNRS